MTFTIKKIIIRNKAYIAVWKKGQKGFFGLFRQKKGITVKEIERVLTQKIEQKPEEKTEKPIFRVTSALIYFYDDFTRVGRLRLVVYTQSPNSFNTNVMRRLLILGDRIVKKMNVVRALGKRNRPLARESKQVDIDEFKRARQPLGIVFGELAGFGLREHKFRMDFK